MKRRNKSKRKSRHTTMDGPWVARKQTYPRRIPQGGIAAAISEAGLGFLGGPPRNPPLKIQGPAYSYVLSVESVASYTTVDIFTARCPRCGFYAAERREAVNVIRGRRKHIATLKVCPICDAGSWKIESQMPGAKRRRAQAARSVI